MTRCQHHEVRIQSKHWRAGYLEWKTDDQVGVSASLASLDCQGRGKPCGIHHTIVSTSSAAIAHHGPIKLLLSGYLCVRPAVPFFAFMHNTDARDLLRCCPFQVNWSVIELKRYSLAEWFNPPLVTGLCTVSNYCRRRSLRGNSSRGWCYVDRLLSLSCWGTDKVSVF
jgi:hypothetical protein